METQKVWIDLNEELYFFILKKVKNKSIANDVLQNTFYKIHKSIAQLKDEKKLRSWAFQIARNEIINFFNQEKVYEMKTDWNRVEDEAFFTDVCCFDKFIEELPKKYRDSIELIYVKGKKQQEAADELEISLTNVKARVRRAKEMLKSKLNECCKYEYDEQGNLTGESNCAACNQ
ncbi:sigma-70 family RNA polymerase sigma factor [Brumimicrobium aurantiacum]|uniref:Sigma-70 family RNA polymerase sigma factor n=1 Tax=Brumimicrobium aurantiacum TaxID=1737063 RepID=A0A3E1EUX8_9FLAO|nr:sigma-70 family RNA polymerase sigma factor [Brumimicrobium aurantiacum]RFC53283.1 sigma-70 family RNA polymerase sigma factor [Brumimicrobium aurantiacum]